MTLTPSDLKTSSKAAAELGVPISEQELDLQSPVLELPGHVPCLLGHPRTGRLVGAACQVHPPAADLDKEEDVEPGQPDCVHGVMPSAGLCRVSGSVELKSAPNGRHNRARRRETKQSSIRPADRCFEFSDDLRTLDCAPRGPQDYADLKVLIRVWEALNSA